METDCCGKEVLFDGCVSFSNEIIFACLTSQGVVICCDHGRVIKKCLWLGFGGTVYQAMCLLRTRRFGLVF